MALFTCAPDSNALDTCYALGALYYATAGAGWINAAGWASAAAGQPTDLCSFHGVTCGAGATSSAAWANYRSSSSSTSSETASESLGLALTVVVKLCAMRPRTIHS